MFRKMRRKDKRLSREQALEVLEAGEEGVLATVGEDGYPYAVPLNYVFHNGAVYFHCAPFGHKIDNMAFNPKVSFCVTSGTGIIAEEFSTRYKSAVIFGRAQEVLGDDKIDGLRALVKRLAPDHLPAGEDYIQRDLRKTRVFKIVVEQISGKTAH
ncbi:MAG: pyridoxamine 5'-phosphate oxidase family protein [Desulfobacter sp.]|nr:MAG: pyridoxamine 5'-phosphate oxidase family protein [Desulfobacter sp.]